MPLRHTGTAPAAGQPIGLWGCAPANQKGQAWKLGANSTLELRSSGGKLCMAHIPGACSGQCLGLGSCDAAALRWKTSTGGGAVAGTYKLLPGQTQCLDVDAKRMQGGAPHSLETYRCNTAFKGGTNEKFSFDEATGQLSSALYSSMTSCVAVCTQSI